MIVYGSRMYGVKDIVKGWGFCDKCGNYSKTSSYNGRKWWHIYFIPIIPEGPRVRVIMECTRCENGMRIPETEFSETLNELRQNSDRAMEALIAGKPTFKIDDIDNSCAEYLSDSIEHLYCLGAEEYVHMLLTTLKAKGLNLAYHLVDGRAMEFYGHLDEAAAAYRAAAECSPRSPLPLMLLGVIDLSKKDYEGARLTYEKALNLSQDKLSVLQILITIYNALKDVDELPKTYEACFNLAPELAKDKKFIKGYKKACKKAGFQPTVF
jgi:tetratricopeptide (TPR) repeat protein